MALKDSFINLNKALRTTLQNVPAVVDTLIRGFDEIGDAADELSTYSATEHVVGKWTDGSDIYETTIDIGKLPNNTSKYTNHGITDIGDIVGIEGIAISTTGSIPVPNAGSLTVAIQIAKASTIGVTTTSNLSDFNGYITVRYTKAAANRVPENDTRNGGDVEPDVKTVEDPAEELKK